MVPVALQTTFANSRPVRIKDGRVTFRYKVRRQRQWKTMTLCAMEVIRRFLQHVLPRGTHKVRYYGIWHPSQRSLLRRVQLATGLPEIPSATEEKATPQTDGVPEESPGKQRKCPCCTEGTLVLAKTLPRRPRPPP